MLRKLISYLLLLLLSTQTVLATVDVHMMLESSSNDIVHHYTDTHSQQNYCEVESNNKSVNSSEADFNNSVHHGCSGHITLFISNHIKFVNHHQNSPKLHIQKRADFISISHSPLFRPPIS